LLSCGCWKKKSEISEKEKVGKFGKRKSRKFGKRKSENLEKEKVGKFGKGKQ
jgi:hypothetical protein